jgi:hypothetical protein
MRARSVAPLGLLLACTGAGGSRGAPDVGDAAPPSSWDASAADAASLAPDPCADAGTPPSSLACAGLYVDFATKALSADALPYAPATPLWSDGAQKTRWIRLPLGTQIDVSDPDEWTFPVGTKLFKEFRVAGRRVETRMFQKTKSDFWVYATYAWSRDESSAPIHYGGPVPAGDDGGTWLIPTNEECDECHRGRQDRILGFEAVSLGLPEAQGLTLARLVELGLVTPAPSRASLTIGEDGTGLAPLALGWLHINCGVTCHNSNPAAAAYGAGMRLRLAAAQLDGSPPDMSWGILKTTLDAPAVSGTVTGEPRIVPGDAAESVLYQFIDYRGTEQTQMPPFGSLLVDTVDVAVVRSWIQAMAGADAGAPIADSGAEDAAPDGSDAAVTDGAAEASGMDAAVDAGADAGRPSSPLDASRD